MKAVHLDSPLLGMTGSQFPFMNFTVSLFIATFAAISGFQQHLFSAASTVWIRHSGFADFSQGTLGDSGRNIYVSAAGHIQMIHRWDLNRDGFPDLVFTQDENSRSETPDVLVYRNDRGEFASLFPPLWQDRPRFSLLNGILKNESHVQHLPTLGAGKSRLADLNRDGWLDLVFVNLIHNYSHRLDAYIYWGGPGFRQSRRTELPTLFAHGLDVADPDADGYLDLGLRQSRGLRMGASLRSPRQYGVLHLLGRSRRVQSRATPVYSNSQRSGRCRRRLQRGWLRRSCLYQRSPGAEFHPLPLLQSGGAIPDRGQGNPDSTGTDRPAYAGSERRQRRRAVPGSGRGPFPGSNWTEGRAFAWRRHQFVRCRCPGRGSCRSEWGRGGRSGGGQCQGEFDSLLGIAKGLLGRPRDEPPHD